MASAYVRVDYFHPMIQDLLEGFEDTYLSEGGLESQERAIKREYIKYAKIPFISGLMDRVLSGDWHWGTSQREVGEELALDRTRLSNALRKGEMSIDTFVAIWFAKGRPDIVFEDTTSVQDMMMRSGFIAAARHLARFVSDRPTLKPDDLNEVRHELIGAMFDNYPLWNEARFSDRELVASDIVERVCKDNRLGIMPGWYTDEQASDVQILADRLRDSATTAMQFLCRLQDDWEDIYVAAAHATETTSLEYR